MYLFDNPVLQRELIVNLRMKRAFVLLLVYQLALAVVVFSAWPQQAQLEANSDQARSLVNLFFLGQYVLASLMAPSFAAGTITGEKERKTYEMLLASPLQPSAICIGKLVSSLAHLALLIFASLPIVMLCIPLGGVSLYEVLAAYLGLILSVLIFGAISVACSSYFQRTSASLVASYLFVLPLALGAISLWAGLEELGRFRLLLTMSVLPLLAFVIVFVLLRGVAARLLHPPDVGSEGNEVVDLEQEAETAIGLVIRRDQFPDRLFAPPQRESLMEDGVNPVYDKEIHSEIFSQGTLMLRLVIQISMILAIPIMAVSLFIYPQQAPWYVAYVLLFNMMVGPVFSAGSVTSERERQTLDLLLTTTITPWQILIGKLVAGLRVSSVLTLFLVWPFFLAVVLVSYYWDNFLAVIAFLLMMSLCCLTTAMIALFFSVCFRKTVTSQICSYMVIALLFCTPVAIKWFNLQFAETENSTVVDTLSYVSPFAAAFSVPLSTDDLATGYQRNQPTVDRLYPGRWSLVVLHVVTLLVLNFGVFALMLWLFRIRWRVAN